MHYFTNSPDLAHEYERVSLQWEGKTFTFITDAGVFSKGKLDAGTALLLEAVGPLSGPCADLGCGWGPIGILLASKNAATSFYMVDINERAVELANRNAQVNGVNNAHAYIGDGLQNAPANLRTVVSNPPIRIGKQPMYALLQTAYEKLASGGDLYIVIRKQQGAASAKVFLQNLFGTCETIARHSGYHVLKSTKP